MQWLDERQFFLSGGTDMSSVQICNAEGREDAAGTYQSYGSEDAAEKRIAVIGLYLL